MVATGGLYRVVCLDTVYDKVAVAANGDSIWCLDLVLGFFSVYYKVAVFLTDNGFFVHVILGSITVYNDIAVFNGDNVLALYLMLGFDAVYNKVAVLNSDNVLAVKAKVIINLFAVDNKLAVFKENGVACARTNFYMDAV